MSKNNNIKIFYKGELDEEMDSFITIAFERMSYVLVGSGYDLREEERDLEFEFRKNPDGTDKSN